MLADHPVEEGEPRPEREIRTEIELLVVVRTLLTGEEIEDLGLHPPKLSPSFGQATSPAKDRPIRRPEIVDLGSIQSRFFLSGTSPRSAAPATDRRRNSPPQKGQGLPRKSFPDNGRSPVVPVESVQGPAGQSKKGRFGV